jgi:hypothetical protein
VQGTRTGGRLGTLNALSRLCHLAVVSSRYVLGDLSTASMLLHTLGRLAHRPSSTGHDRLLDG